jgi:hypothetical protein
MLTELLALLDELLSYLESVTTSVVWKAHLGEDHQRSSG